MGDNFEEEGAALAVVGASAGGFSQSPLDHTEHSFDLPPLAVLLLAGGGSLGEAVRGPRLENHRSQSGRRRHEERRQAISAAALRLSFETDRPLFPYREPNPESAAAILEAKQRLLRIFFVSDKRFQGELTKESPWTGMVAWSDKLPAEKRTELLTHLALPETTGPKEFWLTEFEDYWPYKPAPADLYFSADASQETVKRPPQILQSPSTTSYS